MSQLRSHIETERGRNLNSSYRDRRMKDSIDIVDCPEKCLDMLPDQLKGYQQDMNRIQGESDVKLVIKPGQNGQWQIVIMALYKMGIFSVLLGLMEASRFSVLNGRFFIIRSFLSESNAGIHHSYQSPTKTSSNEKIFSIFTIELKTDTHQNKDCFSDFKTNLHIWLNEFFLGDFCTVRKKLIESLTLTYKAIQGPRGRLLPVTIEYDTDICDSATRLHIITEVTPGFLFSLTNSLSMLNILLKGGEIQRIGSEVKLILWIVDARKNKIVDQKELKQLRIASTLINQFTHLLPYSADPALALYQFKEMVDHIAYNPEWTNDFDSFKSVAVMHTLAEMMGVSRFLWNDFLRLQHQNLFPLISNPERLEFYSEQNELTRKLHNELKAAADDTDKIDIINAFKDREMFRIDLRHITQRISDIRFSRELTELTDVIVSDVARLCYGRLVKRFGEPRLFDGQGCQFAVLAAGKCGGLEMGFASDIELFFIYEGSGETDGSLQTHNSHFFEMLVRLFLRTLKSKQDGIFDIDLRLRPYGEKGTLANSFSAFSEYYSSGGAAIQFERLSLVKMRPVFGDDDLINDIIDQRDSFVYSGHPVDFGNIKHLRNRQAKELTKDAYINAKYSPGGLVDLEYYIQALQIQHGDRIKELRNTNTIIALSKLSQAGLVKEETSRHIRIAYQLMRRIIDALRVVRGNAKDLNVPETDSPTFRYLARRMGYAESNELKLALDEVMAFGKSLWDSVEPLG